MRHSTHVKPISYLKNHAADVANTLAESGEPMLITQNGEARLVVMDVGVWERQEQAMALLKLLALGNQEIEASQFRDAAAVLADLESAAE